MMHRQVLDWASPLALLDALGRWESGRGLPHSKTLRAVPPECGILRGFVFIVVRLLLLSCNGYRPAQRTQGAGSADRPRHRIIAGSD